MILIHVASTWALVGLIWTVHVVHYPLFGAVGQGFRAYHEQHMQRITWVVGPLMLAELATGVLLWLSPPAGTDGRLWFAGLVLLGVIWLETGLFAVPQHGRLAAGFDAGTQGALMAGNLVRSLAWTARGLLMGWVLLGLIDGRAA